MTYAEKVEALYDDSLCLMNAWECEYICEMFEFLQDDEELTDRQKVKIDEIYDKYVCEGDE